MAFSLDPSLSDLEQTHHWAEVAAQAAASKKADDIVILDVGEVLVITDTFVITSAPNDRLVRTIAEEVEKQLKEQGRGGPRRIEGMREAEWVLLDYGEFVVHVFLEETRRFYDLERLWSDAPRVPFVERVPARAAGE
jgi:ribosome-associated protein